MNNSPHTLHKNELKKVKKKSTPSIILEETLDKGGHDSFINGVGEAHIYHLACFCPLLRTVILAIDKCFSSHP